MALEYTFTKEANSNVSVAILDTENNVTTYKSFMMQNVQNVTYNPADDNVSITFDGKSVLTLTAAEVTTPNTANSQALWDALQTTYFFKPTVGAGSGFTLANNGVSDFGGTTVQLGGNPLIQNTTIAAGANNLTITATTGTVSTVSTNGANIGTTSQIATQIQTAVTDGTFLNTKTQIANNNTTTVSNGAGEISTLTQTNDNYTVNVDNGTLNSSISVSAASLTIKAATGGTETELFMEDGGISLSFGGNTYYNANTANGNKFYYAVAMPITNPAIAADTTLDTTHYTVLVDATAANRTITLPAAAGCNGRIYNVKKIDATANTVTIVGTIDGAANKVISAQWTNITIQSNGTAWFIL